MNITGLRVVGPNTVDFPIVGADPSGPFVLLSADDLGPVPIDVRDNGTRVPQVRHPVLLIGLQPQWNDGQTAADLRSQLYGLLTPRGSQIITLQLMNGATVLASAEGQIEKMEVATFTKDPQVQITMKCLGASKSYFLGDKQWPTVSVTSAIGESTFSINNPGTADGGFRIAFQLKEDILEPGVTPPGNIWGLSITKVIPDDGLTMRLLRKELNNNDILYLDTRVGQRMYSRIGDGSLLNDLDPDDDWIQLHPGINEFVVNAKIVLPVDDYPLPIEFTPAYWGI